MPKLSKKIEQQLLEENPDLRARGLRPKIIWVPDTEAPGFQEDLQRQIRAINNSADSQDVLDFLDRSAEDLFRR